MYSEKVDTKKGGRTMEKNDTERYLWRKKHRRVLGEKNKFKTKKSDGWATQNAQLENAQALQDEADRYKKKKLDQEGSHSTKCRKRLGVKDWQEKHKVDGSAEISYTISNMGKRNYCTNNMYCNFYYCSSLHGLQNTINKIET